MFFLNREQARILCSSGHAAVIDTSFHGPLESAATLGMLKTFQLMKPAPDNGRFSPLNMVGAISWAWCRRCPMADRQALIDWPLTPYTGWGGYGIQLAQALLEQGQYEPRLLACNDRSPFCDLHWLDALQHLEQQSAHWRKSWLRRKGLARCQFQQRRPWVFSPLGIMFRRPRFTASKHVGVTFFECSRFSQKDLEVLNNLIW